ncbi:hypothetical protein [Amycolatopsis sp. NPDC004169]|uniref:hypothetical protein n=1 Tax=Amycolatopsis sp. NPDC004169 TaxID=3154453 RepID=UPI0033A89645
MTESVVVSRTDGPHWIQAGFLLAVGAGIIWLGLSSAQQGPRLAGCVFGGSFALLGLNLVWRSLRTPVRNELIIDPAGISRVIGAVVWAVRWDELAAASVVEIGEKHKHPQLVLTPARDDFESHHRSLVRIGGGDLLASGIPLYEREVPRVRELLAKHVGVRAERVADVQVPASPPVPAAVSGWVPPPLQPSGSVTIHMNGGGRVMYRRLRFFALAIELGLGAVIEFGPHNGVPRRLHQLQRDPELPGIALLPPEFLPANDDFPLRRPELDELRQPDGWYRLPSTMSARASGEFDEHVLEVLPVGIPWRR